MECILRYICLPALLFIPQYFASHAEEFLRNAQAMDGNLHVRDDGNETSACGRTELAPQDIALSYITRPDDAHIESSPFRAWNDVPSMLYDPTSERIIHSSDSALRKLESSWIAYIGDCCKIWTIIASIAGTILMASPPFLQMPGTNGDPLVRSFAYLFLFRLAFAFLLAIILLYYFRKNSGSRSSAFAMAWYKNIKKHRTCSHMPWAILASPVIAFCWGILFLILALFPAVWRTGLSLNPLQMEDVHPPILRVVITSMSVADLAYLAWLVAILKALQQRGEGGAF